MELHPDLRVYLACDQGRRIFGPGPVDLLERVESLGSLRAAAIDMGMAYTKATRIVHEAEAALGIALTERTVGGSGGGGSQLTQAAQQLVARYRSFEAACKHDLRRNFDTCFSGFANVARLGCVVLAAGAGERFGGEPGSKLLAPLAGVPVLERTLQALPRDLLDIVVVSRWDGVYELCERLGIRCVQPTGPVQSDSIHSGLAALGTCAGCLFVPGDQPLLTETSVRALVACVQDDPRAVARLSWQGKPGSPVLWPADELASLASIGGDSGGSRLISAEGPLASRVQLIEAVDEWELADVDTTAALASLEDALTRREGSR